MMQSSPFNFRRLVIWLGRLVLGGIFVYAGLSKIFLPNMHFRPLSFLKLSISANLSTFAQQVESYKMLPPLAVDFVAHGLPFVEIGLGLLLFVGWRLKIWATLVTLVMAGFLAAVSRAYLLHMDINCGCFGTPEPLTIKTVIRDSLFTALALLMTYFSFLEARSPHPWSAPEKQ